MSRREAQITTRQRFLKVDSTFHGALLKHSSFTLLEDRVRMVDQCAVNLIMREKTCFPSSPTETPAEDDGIAFAEHKVMV